MFGVNDGILYKAPLNEGEPAATRLRREVPSADAAGAERGRGYERRGEAAEHLG